VKLGFLRPLYSEIGDYVSVYLDTDRVHENSQQAVEIRWKNARDRLAVAGAKPATLEAVAQLMTDRDRGAPGTAAFARDGGISFAGTMPAPPRHEIARLAPLPHVMPLLAQHQPPVPHVRVSATRAGGEIVAIGGDGQAWRDWIAGLGWPLHKTSVGGWSQDRYQRHTEETWDENAKLLAAEVIAAAERIGAQHVIVAGDVHARTLLVAHLPRQLQESVANVEEEVTVDSPEMVHAADAALSNWELIDVRNRFDDFQTRLAHGHAVEGLAATLAAFRDGQVLDLFVADDPSSIAQAWIGPAGAELAATSEELVDFGVPEPVTDRADAALVRAVASTDAELHFLPEDLVTTGDPSAAGGIARPRDGIGATLRFAL